MQAMTESQNVFIRRSGLLVLSLLGGVALLLLLLSGLVSADPIAPPEGYPKLTCR